MTKRFLSKTLTFLLAFLMVFSCLSTAVFAAEDDDLTPDELTVTATEDPKKRHERPQRHRGTVELQQILGVPFAV